MNCIVCGQEHNGSYGSGLFCSQHCKCVYTGRLGAQSLRKRGLLESILEKARVSKTKTTSCSQKTCKNNPSKCKFCGKEYSSLNAANCHEKYCQNNPCRVEPNFRKGNYWNANKQHVAWNKGLTAATDKRVAKQSQSLKHKYVTGELVAYRKGKQHTEKTKQKNISNNDKKDAIRRN